MATLFTPLLKLSGLAVKVIAKPVATRMKTAAAKRPWLSRRFVSLGQWSHYVATRINVFAAGYKFVAVKPLPEEEALNKAADSLSDLLIYSVGAGIIVIEFVRSERKNAEKAASTAQKEKEALEKMEARFRALEQATAEYEQVLPEESRRKLAAIRKKTQAAAEDEKIVQTSSETASSSAEDESSLLGAMIRKAKQLIYDDNK